MQEASGELAGLIRRAKQYDQTAFGDLYRLAVVPVHRYLSVRLDNIEDAEELTQEVFLAALSGIQSVRATDETGLMAWLFQIARHKLADYLRRRYRKPVLPLTMAEEVESAERSPDESAAAREERGIIRAALERLTSEQREVIVLKFIMGHSNEQTARLVGKNANAVNQLQHRALASLHRLLGDKGKVG